MNGTDADYRDRVVHPAYPIETDRLLLRPLDPDRDTDDVYAYASRPDVCRYIPFEPKDRDQVQLTVTNGSLVVTAVSPTTENQNKFEECVDRVMKTRRKLLKRLSR